MFEPICPTCRAGPSYTIPVWEDPSEYDSGEPPDYIGCTQCGRMNEVDR